MKYSIPIKNNFSPFKLFFLIVLKSSFGILVFVSILGIPLIFLKENFDVYDFVALIVFAILVLGMHEYGHAVAEIIELNGFTQLQGFVFFPSFKNPTGSAGIKGKWKILPSLSEFRIAMAGPLFQYITVLFFIPIFDFFFSIQRFIFLFFLFYPYLIYFFAKPKMNGDFSKVKRIKNEFSFRMLKESLYIIKEFLKFLIGKNEMIKYSKFLSTKISKKFNWIKKPPKIFVELHDSPCLPSTTGKKFYLELDSRYSLSIDGKRLRDVEESWNEIFELASLYLIELGDIPKSISEKELKFFGFNSSKEFYAKFQQ